MDKTGYLDPLILIADTLFLDRTVTDIRNLPHHYIYRNPETTGTAMDVVIVWSSKRS